MTNDKIYNMLFAKVYPLLIAKAEKKEPYPHHRCGLRRTGGKRGGTADAGTAVSR